MAQLLEEQRENWGSRAGFVLAAIGSAVGLGNLWGFPYKVYDNGGGAFLVPYLLAMLLIGVPLLILEFSLGHMTQRAAPDAYRGVNRRTEPVGWWGIILGFVIITYYPVILAYCGNYLIECVRSVLTGRPLPWSGRGIEGVQNAEKYFYQTFLNRWTDADAAAGVKSWALGGVVWPILASLGVIWGLMYLCIFRGIRLVGKVVLWTVPLPWIMLLILTIRGLTLPGAGQGLNFYLSPNWEMLARPETWRWAFGQMFFSMSLAFGVMITYASFLHRKSDINNNATIIGLADVGTSFVAGVAVFATLGAMAYATQQAGDPVAVTQVVKEGPGLAFAAFPYALAQLGEPPWPAVFGAVFFIALLTLGIDSAFSITESVLASLVDKTGWNRTKTLIGISLVGFGLGVFYCTRGGLTWLGTMDDFINTTWGGICLLGLLEFVVLGWAYRLGRLREHANERSDWKVGIWWEWIVRYIAPVILSFLFAWHLLEQISGDFLFTAGGELKVPRLVGVIVAVLAPLLAVALSAVRSPGADAHAQHVGQPRHGRSLGAVALLLTLVAAAGVGWAAREVFVALHDGVDALSICQYGGREMPHAAVILAAAGATGLLGLVLGAVAVRRAETTDRRPSGLARAAGGMGVLTVGAAGGVGLALRLALHPVGQKAGRAAVSHANELEGMGYVVLTVMVALLVVGLGWCFYRAIKAAGGAEEQLPTGIDNT